MRAHANEALPWHRAYLCYLQRNEVDLLHSKWSHGLKASSFWWERSYLLIIDVLIKEDKSRCLTLNCTKVSFYRKLRHCVCKLQTDSQTAFTSVRLTSVFHFFVFVIFDKKYFTVDMGVIYIKKSIFTKTNITVSFKPVYGSHKIFVNLYFALLNGSFTCLFGKLSGCLLGVQGPGVKYVDVLDGCLMTST